MARTFYQNPAINPATMNFNFAHVYSNRYEMDTKCLTDGIYPGRYVLVEYDKAFEPITKNNQGEWEFSNSYSYKKAYALNYDENGGIINVIRVSHGGHQYEIENGASTFLTSLASSEERVILYSNNLSYDENDVPIGVTKDTIVVVGNLDGTVFNFYQCIEGTAGQPAQFKWLDLVFHGGVVYYNGQPFDASTASAGEIYGYNYAIDKAHAESLGIAIGRGYDSTVWQKTIVNGSPKYVQIAELNTVTPTFDLLVDAPKDEGQTPYFDEISSNVYYRLHDTPHWGLRVKEAEYDEDTTTDTFIYPSDVEENNKSLAIYWNQSGFDKENISYDSLNENNIKVANTGISGREYVDTNGPAPDIKEISIILPELGNTISDIWDIVYGDREINEYKWEKTHNGEYEDTRETDIQWYNANVAEEEKTKGLRLVDYNIGPDETYDYQPDEVSTLAGCINSVHDLMGMIIYPDDIEHPIDMTSQQVINDLSSDYIYYINNKYYRRGIETSFNTNYDPNDLFKPINVIPYDPNDKYFYKDLTNFKRLVGNPSDEIPYYKFNNEPVDMELTEGLYPEFTNNRYYYTTGSGSTQTIILEGNGWHSNREYYDMTFQGRAIAFYQADKYWLPIDPSLQIGLNNRQNPTEAVPDPDTRYYYLYQYSRVNEETHTVEYVDAYKGIMGSELTTFEAWTYFTQDPTTGNYKLITQDTIPFYNDTPTIGEEVNLKLNISVRTYLSDPLNFYVPNRYYYKFYIGDPENDVYDYYLDANVRKTEDRDYYLLVNNPVKVDKFYKPNEFYYDDNGVYIIDTNQNYTSGRTYYDNSELYVVADTTNTYRIGSEWNSSINPVPQGVTLGVKVNRYVWREMVGFARNLNTIHGMLLKLNALMNTDDTLTRNTDTVQGCINKINDIIDIFGGLIPNSVLMANESGKVVTGTLTGDSWTSLSAAAGPQLRVSHLGQASTKTTTTSDLNSTNGNTIVLLDVTTDTKGHVTAESRTTVTLPNSYGSISGDSGTVSSSDSTDTLTIAGDGSLISTSAANNTLTVSHETHTVIPDDTPRASLSSENSIPTITINQYGYDGAGHIISETNTTVSGVAGYGVVKGDNYTVENPVTAAATASLDTLAITGDTWLGTSAANDAVSLSHKAPAAVTPTALSNETPSFGSTFTLTDWHYDSTGHKDGSSTHTITIPQGSLVDDNTEYSSSANVLTGITFASSSGRIGYTHQNASTLVLTGYNSAHNIISATGTIGDAFAAIEGKFNTLEGNIGSNDSDITALQNSVDTINNTTIPNIINTTIPGAVSGAVRDLVNGATTAFDTFKEIEDWINDGNTGAAALVTRVGALETAVNNLNGSGSGSISSQLSNYVLKSEATGYGDILTKTEAQTTYQTLLIAGTDYVQPATLASYQPIGNYIETSDTFTYDNSDPLDPVEMTVAQLVAYVKTLEDRIAILEGGGGGGGNEPEPQTPATPDVVIEFTQGVGSTTAVFNDVLTNINGDNDLTYSVVVDNTEIDLDQTTPVEVEENNGEYTIIINLDDSTYEKVTWADDGTLTLVSL